VTEPHKTVVLTGAGISVESGLPTFGGRGLQRGSRGGFDLFAARGDGEAAIAHRLVWRDSLLPGGD